MKKHFTYELLIGNMFECFNAYKLIHGDNLKYESLNKYGDEDENEDEHCNVFIVETGFFCFFLLMKMLENNVITIDLKTRKTLKNTINEATVSRISSTRWYQQITLWMIFPIAYGVTAEIMGLLFYCCRGRKSDKIVDEQQAKTQFTRTNKQTISNDDDGNNNGNNEVDEEEELKTMLHFYASNSASAEFCIDNIVEKVWFIKMPYFQFLYKQLMKKFNESVDRSTYRNKIKYLLDNTEKFINISIMGYNIDSVLRNIFVFNVLYKYNEFFTD